MRKKSDSRLHGSQNEEDIVDVIDNKDRILKGCIKEARFNLKHLWSLKVVPIKAYRQAVKLFMRLRAINKDGN